MTRRNLEIQILATSLALLLAGPLLGAKGGGGKGGGYLPTCDRFEPGPDFGVQSDGAGVLAGNDDPHTYCDSERHVSAVIGQTRGGHHLDTKRSGRELVLDFSRCPSAPCPQLPGFGGSTEAVLSLEHGDYPDGVDLLEMANNETRYVGVVIGFDNGSKNHVRLSFGRDSTVVACPDSGDKVRVTRLDESTWELESGPADLSCLSEVQNNDWNDPVSYGYFHLPFLLQVSVEP